MEVAGKVFDIVSDLMKDAVAKQEADQRQAQIMNALGAINQSIKSLQLEEEQLAALGRVSSSFTDISVWQSQYPDAVKNYDTKQIAGFLAVFNSKGPDGAAFHIQNIFNVMSGEGLGLTVPSILPSWHTTSYKKMYTPVNGQYTFTLKDYLADYDATISWAIGMAGYALVCEIIALQDLADKTTTTPENIKNEAKQKREDFSANVDLVLGVAYNLFPPFVKKFKPSYKETGTNLGQWFRIWRSGCHVKNFTVWTGDGNYMDPEYRVGKDGTTDVFQIFPILCDDSEGIYPELEFRFNESNHPLYGLTNLISRMNGDSVFVYTINNGGPNGTGLTTTSDPSNWMEGASFFTAAFNVLPVSSEDSGTDAPGFVLMPANVSSPSDQQWLWNPGTASPLGYWILRDDGIQQTDWVKTSGSESTVPDEPSRAPGPNPADNGNNQTRWKWWSDSF